MKKEFTYVLPAKLPANGCTIVYTKNRVVIALEVMRPGQFVCTIPGFIELAESVGYRVTRPKISKNPRANVV
jgi:hypothetical protein